MSIEQIIKHLKDLSPKDRSSVIDHVCILIAAIWMIKIAFNEQSFTGMQNLVGIAFAPQTTMIVSIAAILGCLLGCNVIVHKLSNYD